MQHLTQRATEAATGRVLAVNVGAVRVIKWMGRAEPSGIWKSPAAGRIMVRGVNVDGDHQGDRRAHGGPDKAVYAYAREDAAWWEGELGRPVGPGEFGENLTLIGVAVTDAVIGERWAIGGAILEVAQPRMPCWKLGARMRDTGFVQRFAAAGRPGAYLRIIGEGDIGAGDEVRVLARPSHGVTVGDVADIYVRDRARAEVFLRVPELPPRWRAWAEKALGSKRHG